MSLNMLRDNELFAFLTEARAVFGASKSLNHEGHEEHEGTPIKTLPSCPSCSSWFDFLLLLF